MKQILLIFIVISSFSTLAQQTYFVATDGNNVSSGSNSNPWLTIQYGISNIASGDTLIVKTGSYNETILIQSNFTTVIKISAQENVIIDGNGISPIDRQGLITIRDASNIIVEGFEIRNFKTVDGVEINNTPVGILMDGDISNVILRNNIIHDIQNRSTCGQSSDCGPGANGIAVYGDTSAGIVDIELNNNEVYNCVLASSEAFTINGNVDRFKVINNYVHDNNNIAFDFIGYEDDVCNSCTVEMNRARNGYVKGNRAINNSIKLSVGGFTTNPWYENDDGNAGGFYVDGGRNIIFDGNYSSQNDLGFEFASEHSGKSSEDILMINNYIYDNRELGLSIGGYAESAVGEGGGNAKRINVYNNSFYKNQGWGTEINFAFRVIDFNAVNNIFYGTADLNDNFYQEPNGQHSNTSFHNNIWWANDNSDSSGLPEASPIVIHPQYQDASNGDLGISSSSPAINFGQSQANITWNSQLWIDLFGSNNIPVHGLLDINNQARIEDTTIDIGADEFGTFADLIFKHGFE